MQPKTFEKLVKKFTVNGVLDQRAMDTFVREKFNKTKLDYFYGK